jgi:translation initiation factor 2-alpha kinase 3
LDVANTVKIADFGIALTQSALLPEDDDSNSKQIKNPGTEIYMPPSREPVTFKRDIYALRIILFELLYPFSTVTERAKA